MIAWTTQLIGLLTIIGGVASLSYRLGYEVRKDEERRNG